MSAPVRHTCPDIDKVIDGIKQAMNDASNGKVITEKNSDEWLHFDGIIDSLYGLEYVLEDLRKSNDSLRGWGHDLEKEISSLERELEKMETRADVAEGNCKVYEKEISKYLRKTM